MWSILNTGDVSCFGHDCYMLAFGVPALLMILSIGMWLALLSLYILLHVDYVHSLKQPYKIFINSRWCFLFAENVMHTWGPEKFTSVIVFRCNIILPNRRCCSMFPKGVMYTWGPEKFASRVKTRQCVLQFFFTWKLQHF